MTDSKPEGFQPAPWEAGGKKKTQGPQAGPPGYGQPQPGYGQPQPGPQPGPQGVPLGGPAPNAFGGGDTGRARTKQVQKGGPGPTIGQPFDPRQANAAQQPPQNYASPPPQPGGYPQQPGGYPPQQGGPYGGAQGGPYQQGGAPQGAPPPGGAYPPGGPQQPYGDTGYMTRKPTTVFGIVALCLGGVGVVAGLVSFGLASAPFFLIGGILGYLGIRETASWGKKSGRGLAMAGTIANVVLLVLNVAAVIAMFLLIRTGADILESEMNAKVDAKKIESRIVMYKEAKGDLKPGGPQMFLGSQQPTAVSGSQLTVQDLLRPTELKNPIEQYTLQIDGDKATIWWTPEDGARQNVGSYPPPMRFEDFEDWESDWETSQPPPPRRH